MVRSSDPSIIVEIRLAQFIGGSIIHGDNAIYI